MFNVNKTQGLLDELLDYYLILSEKPNFDQYLEYSDRIDRIYIELNEVEITTQEKEKILKIEVMHNDLMNSIIQEKKLLEQEMIDLEMKKNVSNVYTKKASYFNPDAFFVDVKN